VGNTLHEAASVFEACGAQRRHGAVQRALDDLDPRVRRSRGHLAEPVGLTNREREVAHLALDGLSAREIGARLFIGERTVETHLANTYAKLGVAGRTELIRRRSELDLA
jgi:DNA-binding CsgD family transcriptional regulator